jgi:hypothetical protein
MKATAVLAPAPIQDVYPDPTFWLVCKNVRDVSQQEESQLTPKKIRISHKTPPPNLKEQKGHMTHPTQFSPIRDIEQVKLFLHVLGCFGCPQTVGRKFDVCRS